MDNISPGGHTITLTLDGYNDYEQQITAKIDEEIKINAILLSKPNLTLVSEFDNYECFDINISNNLAFVSSKNGYLILDISGDFSIVGQWFSERSTVTVLNLIPQNNLLYENLLYESSDYTILGIVDISTLNDIKNVGAFSTWTTKFYDIGVSTNKIINRRYISLK